jgi:hypothetical protein
MTCPRDCKKRSGNGISNAMNENWGFLSETQGGDKPAGH